MKLKSVLSLGAITLVLLLGIAYMTFGVLKFNPLKDYITATMLLPTSGGLGPRSPVLLTGVEVGNVTAVRKSATGVEAEIRIDDKFKIPADSTIRIENLSALGEPYVMFIPSGDQGPYIENDQLIDTRGMTAPASISDLSVKLVELINQLDPTVVRSLVDGFSGAIKGTANEVPRLERATKLLAATILARTDSIRKLLANLQVVSADMDWAGPSLQEAGPWWAHTGDRFEEAVKYAGEGIVAKRLPEEYMNGDGLVPFLRDQLNPFLQKIGPAMVELLPILQPLVGDITNVVAGLDISTLLSQAVNTVGDDGAIHLQINVK